MPKGVEWNLHSWIKAHISRQLESPTHGHHISSFLLSAITHPSESFSSLFRGGIPWEITMLVEESKKKELASLQNQSASYNTKGMQFFFELEIRMGTFKEKIETWK